MVVTLLGSAHWRDLGALVSAASLLLQSVCGPPPATGTVFGLLGALGDFPRQTIPEGVW